MSKLMYILAQGRILMEGDGTCSVYWGPNIGKFPWHHGSCAILGAPHVLL